MGHRHRHCDFGTAILTGVFRCQLLVLRLVEMSLLLKLLQLFCVKRAIARGVYGGIRRRLVCSRRILDSGPFRWLDIPADHFLSPFPMEKRSELSLVTNLSLVHLQSIVLRSILTFSTLALALNPRPTPSRLLVHSLDGSCLRFHFIN